MVRHWSWSWWPVVLAAVSTGYGFYLLYSEYGYAPQLPMRIDATARSLILLAFIIWFLLELYSRLMARLDWLAAGSERLERRLDELRPRMLATDDLIQLRQRLQQQQHIGVGNGRVDERPSVSVAVAPKETLDQFLGEAAEAYELGRQAGLAERDLPHQPPTDDQPGSSHPG